MRPLIDDLDFEKKLADEWPRLVRLCAWFSGSRSAAEDLAQETMIAAWKSRERLISLESWNAWTSAIARNVCLNWSRGHYREQNHSAYSLDMENGWIADGLGDGMDLELELDRADLARLLDQALSLLPAETAQMLVDHYMQDFSQAEIAERMRIKPGTVAVRLQRGKMILRKLLRKNLSAEASAYGLIHEDRDAWEETNIWCPWCGRARLMVKYQKNETFALRCPSCDPEPDRIMTGLDLTKACHTRLLGNTKTYKPAYSRLLRAFRPLYQQALKTGTTACLACGKPVEVILARDQHAREPSSRFDQIILHCHVCGWASNKSTHGLVVGSQEAQRFWRNHPRLKTLPLQDIEVQGSLALLTRLQSVTDSAQMTLITRRDTMEILQVYTNARL